MSPKPTVFVVDDDTAVRESLRWLIESVGLDVHTYASAREFLESMEPSQTGCLVLDIRMPGMSGLELQEALAERGSALQVIIVTGHGDVPMAVRAMKAGASDFIEKPFNDQMLLDRIQQLLKKAEDSWETQARRERIMGRYEHLTPREREVMALVVEGKSNKRIALDLGVSAKTIEVHRAKVMEKMEAGSLADLVRMSLAIDPEDEAGAAGRPAAGNRTRSGT
ncbi:response regulator transcription factor [Ectothiorhodospiraceae bacterium 2226]|nr:response regulator transcription factor [Ectothiorhodospiraceae bacterium 2226]